MAKLMPAYHPVPTAQPDLTATNQVQSVRESTPSGASPGQEALSSTVSHLLECGQQDPQAGERPVSEFVCLSRHVLGSLDLRICEVNWAW